MRRALWAAGGAINLGFAALLLVEPGRFLLASQLGEIHRRIGATSAPPSIPGSPDAQLFVIGFALAVAALGAGLLFAAARPERAAWFPPLDGLARLVFAAFLARSILVGELSPALWAIVALDGFFGFSYLVLAGRGCRNAPSRVA